MSLVKVLRTVRKIPLSAAAIGPARQQQQYSSTASLTDSPGWLRKMKDRFSALDVDKNGVINEQDVHALAKKLASYRNEGEDVSRRYFATFNAVFGVQKPTTEEEFLSEMKEFVSKPDSRDRAKSISDMTFDVMDEDKNDEVSFDEFSRFHKTVSKMPEEMVMFFFKKSDLNGDGIISKSELRESTMKFFFSNDY